MIGIQVLLLAAERRHLGSRGVIVPGLVPRLRVGSTPPLPIVVLPDGEPRFQERAGYLERCSNGTCQELCERLLFFSGQMPWLMQEERAVKPQVFAHSADLVPIVPGCGRWWLEEWRRPSSSDQLSDRRRVGGRELEPLANGTVIDANCSADCTRGLDLRM